MHKVLRNVNNSNPIGQNVVTWPHRGEREAEEQNLCSGQIFAHVKFLGEVGNYPQEAVPFWKNKYWGAASSPPIILTL